MAKNKVDVTTLGKEYILSLLDALEEKKKEIDPSLFDELKNYYTEALNEADSSSFIWDGFVNYKAFAPDLETIKDSVNKLEERFSNFDEETRLLEKRIEKLDELVSEKKINESTARKKRSEYRVLIHKIDDEKNKLVKEIPQSLMIIQQLDEILQNNLDELTAESALEGKSKTEIEKEKKRIEKLHRDTKRAAKKLAELAEINLEEKQVKTREQPVQQRRKRSATSTTSISSTQPQQDARTSTRIRPQDVKWIKWKNITIGKLIGSINIVGSNFGVIATDRPSLAIIRDIALVGPSRLRSTSNPREIEDRLRKYVVDKYGVSEKESLYPEHLVKYTLEENLGVDLLKLINSYYASVRINEITYDSNDDPTILSDARVLTLAENTELLGRRVLAPDRALVGVIHELYLDPTTIQLYSFAFKGVPPQVIRKVYRDTHNRALSENNFGDFRNEIAKKLSIPIYEALTPSSIIRYVIQSGLIKTMNQLVAIIESMNPRVSRISDINSISSRGVLLSRFPQNSLPDISYVRF